MSKIAPRVPSVGPDPREEADAVTELPEKVWFRNLDEAVIESDRCIQCGSCVAACPSDSIGIDEEENRPTLVRMCTGCSSCWDYCPRSGLRYERLVELIAEERGLDEPMVYSAKALDMDSATVGQDGGVVTELLARLLEVGEIDGAIVAAETEADLPTVGGSDGPLHGAAAIATTREELYASAGSVYNQILSLGRIDELVAAAELDDPSLALVGTPCVIEGASALERYDHEGADTISLSIALMCTRSFEHERLISTLEYHGVNMDAIEKLDVSDGVLFAYDGAGQVLLDVPVEEFDAASLRGCDECGDFIGGCADLSAGSIASEDGRTSVVVRTERGERAWNRVADSLDVDVLESVDTLRRIEAWNRRRARRYLQREYDPTGSVGIGYIEHRQCYDGSDRSAKPFNPARVHQYEEWC